MNASIQIAKGRDWLPLSVRYLNRHGLIAGATGTGKTVTLHTLAEQCSLHGIPVLVADVKGDLAGLSQPSTLNDRISSRIQQMGYTGFTPQGVPVVFWDVFRQIGHPLRTTISEMGPLLLSRLLQLNPTQEGVLHIAFKLADDEGMVLLDLKDLRALLQEVANRSSELQSSYGNVSSASVGSIQRGLLTLESQGGTLLFGEPALRLADLMRTDFSGRGVVNIVCAQKLLESPKVYATLLLWLLSELYEQLPEVGDIEKPRLVFFFDEAHLLFDDAAPALVDRIEQVVRLIRSKGVGVFFVTQHPLDIPEKVAAQLGNRIQHALRAFSPKEQRALRAVAETFRCDDASALERDLLELVPGEAVVSFMGADGAPTKAERALILPPASRIGTITDQERRSIMADSLVGASYDVDVERVSAYEQLRERATREQPTETPRPARQRQTPVEAMVSSTMRSIGSQIGRQIVRGILGSLGSRRS
ncbi:MAG: DUF853 family protein [Bdellovibrionota bacterium]|nr:MAG: DUF853 family protein [Bdellovibrionota bacterium]